MLHGAMHTKVFENVVIETLFVSVYGFSDVKSRPVIQFFIGFPVPFHFKPFRIGCVHESAENVDKRIFSQIKDCFGYATFKYSTVTNWPNVMIKPRTPVTGEEKGGSKFAVFSYGCARHAISLIIEYFIKLPKFRSVFKMSTNVTYFLKHVPWWKAVGKRKEKLSKKLLSLKTFSQTR